MWLLNWKIFNFSLRDIFFAFSLPFLDTRVPFRVSCLAILDGGLQIIFHTLGSNKARRARSPPAKSQLEGKIAFLEKLSRCDSCNDNSVSAGSVLRELLSDYFANPVLLIFENLEALLRWNIKLTRYKANDNFFNHNLQKLENWIFVQVFLCFETFCFIIFFLQKAVHEFALISYRAIIRNLRSYSKKGMRVFAKLVRKEEKWSEQALRSFRQCWARWDNNSTTF